MKKTAFLAVALMPLLTPGCARHTTPVTPRPQLTPAEKNFNAVWEASLETLRENRFRIDRLDRRAGLITTLPMVGMQVAEFWRDDAVTARGKAESTLQTLYKKAIVEVARTGPEAITYDADVTVEVYRSDHPSPQLTSTSEAIDMFYLPSGFAQAPRTLLINKGADEEGRPAPASAWIVSLGRDRNLEVVLEAQIEAETSRKRVASR